MGKYSCSGRKHTKIIRSSAAKQENVKLNNYISSSINHEINQTKFREDEEDLIIRLHSLLGNRWSLIAGRLPGRTADEVKNHWESQVNTKSVSTATTTCACCNKKPRPPNFAAADDDDGEIDLSLTIGLPSSAASSQRFISAHAEEEKKKKIMMMKEEVISRDVEAAQINDYETPVLLLFR